MAEEYRVHTLKNGLRTIVIDIPGGLFYSGMYVRCGEDDETLDTLEAAHYLEHLNSTFTSSKYTSSEEITRQFDALGVETNASTCHKETTYYIEGCVRDAKYLLDVFSHAFANFVIDVNIMQSEACAVQHELREGWKNVPWYLADEFIKTKMYGNRHVRSTTIDSHIQNIDTLKCTPNTLLEFRKSMYSADNLVWIVAGPNDPVFRQCISTTMETLQTCHRTESSRVYPVINRFEGGTHTIAIETASSARITCRYALSFASDDVHKVAAVDQVTRLLSEGFSSRLIKRLRTELGLVYDVDVTYTIDERQNELSYMEIELTCDPDAVYTALKEIRTALRVPITKNELAKLTANVQKEKYTREYDHHPASVVSDMASSFVWHNTIRTFADERQDYIHAIKTNLVQEVLFALDTQIPFIVIAHPMDWEFDTSFDIYN